jgi:sugar lactone lactonase YvrE
MTGDAIPCTRVQRVLGEGLRWDAGHGEMLAVDILGERVFRVGIDDDGGVSLIRDYWVAAKVGAVAPVYNDEGWLLAAGRGFVYLSRGGYLNPLAEVAPLGHRMNDAACDPQGRFWAGTLADDSRPGGGTLYRLDHNGAVEVMLRDLTISNGLGWSPDGTTMYLADSGPRLIHAFDFDGETGALSGPRVLVTIDEETGTPDGLTVDADGDLWVAIYGGGQVRRYSPDGVLRETLRVPASQSTSCAFAGPHLNRLYVTTATEGWSDEQRRAQPGAGLVYRFDTNATGRPADPFRPDPTWWAKAMTGH